ncbi:MAG: hypothetical protein JZU55_02090, partial [Afipia sp.]|nr:hypothetical protein [Afipia sp.]
VSNKVAVLAVRGEPSSGYISLFYREETGNFAELAFQRRPQAILLPKYHTVSAVFPIAPNRELLPSCRESICRNRQMNVSVRRRHGCLVPIAPALLHCGDIPSEGGDNAEAEAGKIGRT